MVFRVKISCEGQLLVMPSANKSDVSFEAIQKFVKESFESDAFVARYLDDEGDACTLSALSMPDALHLAGTGPLKLQLQLVPEAPSKQGFFQELAQSTESAVSERAIDDGDEDDDFLLTLPPGVAAFAISTPAPSSPATSPPASPRAVATPAASVASSSSFEFLPLGSEADTTISESDAAQAAEEPPAEVAAPMIAPPTAPPTAPPMSPVESAASTVATTDDDVDAAVAAAEAAAAAAADADGDGAVEAAAAAAELSDMDKVSWVLAAFDANGDGHLDFEESNQLQQAAWGGTIGEPDFRRLCAELGADPDVGLGAEDLWALYGSTGLLDRDFRASVERLQGGVSQAGEAAPDRSGAEAQAPSSGSSGSSGWGAGHALIPLVGLPLVLAFPLIGVPAVLFAATLRAHRCHCR